MESENKVPMGFVQRRLPWLVAAAALVLYLVTLNHSATFPGIAALAKAAGWEWRPSVIAPLNFLVTYPIRWLPAGAQLFCLNFLAAACASLALGLLARCVALLPHDRTREQRAAERSEYSMLTIPAAWLPPVLAALVCGLQLTFWENAVVATGEALDLLIFAWLVHCLLQYRLDGKESRLSLFAFVYGVAVTNNFAMIAFFPAFLTALIWIKGMSFFKVRFLLKMLGLGVAGLLLYLLLPAIESTTNTSGYTFWNLLKGNWINQRDSLLALPRGLVAICLLTSVLPVLFISIRWPAQFGDISPAGNALTNLMTHVIHLLFLAACIYVAFDPQYSPSPRAISGGMFAFLPLYFLGALTVGYCSGYFLLVFGDKAGLQSWQRPSALRKAVNKLVVALVWLTLIAVPAALAYQNFPIIWASAGSAIDRLSQATVKSLPEQGAVVLSDDLFRLYALKHELEKSNPNHKHILVDTSSLLASGYHRFLQQRFADRWPKFAREPEPGALMAPRDIVGMLYQFSQSGPLYYLQPSFGLYFEYFHARPRQMAYELKLNPTNAISPPPLTAAEIKQQDAYWRSLKAKEFDPLIKKAVPFVKPKPGKEKPRPRTLETYLSENYSRMLNQFGVLAQRAGEYALAGEYFEWALQLNPASPSAFLNREFNQLWREKRQISGKLSEGAGDRLAMVGGSWDAILGISGPVDEPSACYLLANALEQGGNHRQAAENLQRTLVFDPANRSAQLVLISLHVNAQLPALALEMANAFRARHSGTLTEEEEMELLRAEAWAHVARNDLPSAERLLSTATTRFPRQAAPWETLVDIYLQAGQPTNAIATLDRQLQAQPDSIRALLNYGAINGRLGRFAEAVPYFDRVLRLSPNDELGLINRAVANEKLDRLDAAQRDYESLLKVGKSKFRVAALYGLGEINFRKKNRSESLRYFREFIKAAPEGTQQIPIAKDRIKLLESGGTL